MPLKAYQKERTYVPAAGNISQNAGNNFRQKITNPVYKTEIKHIIQNKAPYSIKKKR